MDLFFALGRVLGVGAWPYVPPEVAPKDYGEYSVEVLARRRVQDNARDLVAETLELKIVLPPCMQPLFPAYDPLGVQRPGAKAVTGAASKEVMQARVPSEPVNIRFWM